MKTFLIPLAALLAASSMPAGEAGEFLSHPGKPVAQPDFKTMPSAPWTVAKGRWEAADGVLVGAEKKEEHHAAVLWHVVPLASAVVECEIQFDGAGTFIIGCDGQKHIGRLVITPKFAKLSEDATEVKGVHPGATLAEVKHDLKRGQWYVVRYGWKDDRMFATVDGQELAGQHPSLGTARTRWWFAVGGDCARLRNVKVSEGRP
jgi:hypothetical protein